MNLLLLGATGLVGSHVLQQALADPRITRVVAPTRRPLPPHPKLIAPNVDFDALPQHADWWHADALLCTVGTTMKKAGSRDAFRHVDHTIPLQAARLAHAHGTPCLVLCSAMGADPDSRFFYNRVKGELERDLATIGFASFTSVRPGIIAGAREEHRLAERWALRASTAIARWLPRQWRPSPAVSIAQAMLSAAITSDPGRHIVPAATLARPSPR